MGIKNKIYINLSATIFLATLMQGNVYGSKVEAKVVDYVETNYQLEDQQILQLKTEVRKQEYIEQQRLIEEEQRQKEKAQEQKKQEQKKQEEPITLEVVATAYLPDCEGCIGITKTGYDVRSTSYYKGMRVAACDPQVLPLYTVFKSDELEDKMICVDTGGDIKQNRIDILTLSKEWAANWGRREIEITIIKDGE